MVVTVLGTNLYPYFRSGLGCEQDRAGPNTSYELKKCLTDVYHKIFHCGYRAAMLQQGL